MTKDEIDLEISENEKLIKHFKDELSRAYSPEMIYLLERNIMIVASENKRLEMMK